MTTRACVAVLNMCADAAYLKLIPEGVECLQRILLIQLAPLTTTPRLLLLAARLHCHEGQVLVKVLIVIHNVMRKGHQLQGHQQPFKGSGGAGVAIGKYAVWLLHSLVPQHVARLTASSQASR